MTEPTADKISKAETVNIAVKELLGRLKASRMAANFSIAVVTFDTSAIPHTPVTAVAEADDYGDYDPLRAHGGGTDIGAGLRCAQGLLQQFLSAGGYESVPRSVCVILMSDGKASQDSLVVANELKQIPKVTLCTTLFAAAGDDVSRDEQLLRDMATSPKYYRTTYRANDLRNFFTESMSSGTNVKIS
jgi:uncharacterized protein YegL